MIKLIYFLLIVLFMACASDKTENETSTSYFDADEIIHIRILISDTDYITLYNKHEKTEQEKKLFAVLTQPLDEDLEGTSIIEDLKGIDKTEYKIQEKYLAQLKTAVFVEKPCGDFAAEVCDPCYRDILLFKKNETITGIGKFSFNCRISDFAGTNAKDECFGAFGEFDTLRKILKENSAL